MTRKNILTRASLVAAMALTVNTVNAQDVHFTQFTASPLIVNPAFTGAANGQWRAAAVYRDQWRSVTVPFRTFAASFDAPVVHDLTTDDYLAAGIQLYNDRAGDGNLANLSALVSVAYHKFLGGGNEPNKSLSVGFQGGYTQKSIDLSKLYFGDEYDNGVFNSGTSQEYPWLNNKDDYFIVNAGIGWSHSVSENFGYQLGVGANNLNQPGESFHKRPASEVGLGMRYTGQLGMIIYTSEKFSLRPAALYQSQATATEIVAGNEFHYIIGNPEIRSFTSAVFLGGYYRMDDAILANVGFEYKGLRFGLSYDYNVSNLKNASRGNGGFEISVVYVAANPLDFARRLVYPCSRF